MHHFVHGFMKFAEAFTKAFSSGALVKSAIQRIADEARSRKDLSESEKHRLDADVNEFCKAIDGIWREEPDVERLVQIQQAVLLTAIIAGRHGVSQSYVKELDRMRAAPANKARRADDVQKIIENAAKALWKNMPSFKTNDRGTAVKIRTTVRSELEKLDKLPTGWKLADDSDSAAVKREIERIEGRVGRVERQDDCHSSD